MRSGDPAARSRGTSRRAARCLGGSPGRRGARLLLVCLTGLASPPSGSGAAPGEAGDAPSGPAPEEVVWTFDGDGPGGGVGRLDSRAEIPLSRWGGPWRQVVGAEAAPAAPHLYPALPEPRLRTLETAGAGTSTGGVPRFLELRTRGARVRVESEPHRLPALSGYVLECVVGGERLGGGRLRIGVSFLAPDGASEPGGGSFELAPSGLDEGAGWSSRRERGQVPLGATHAVIALELIGSDGADEEVAAVRSLRLVLSPGLRIEFGRPLPVFQEDEAVEPVVSVEGLARGEHRIFWELRPAWRPGGIPPASLPGGAGGPLERGDPITAGSLRAMAVPARELRVRLQLSGKGSAGGEPSGACPGLHLAPGGYELAIRAGGPGWGREGSALLAVLPLSPWCPRGVLTALETELGVERQGWQYLGCGDEISRGRSPSIHWFALRESGGASLLAVPAGDGGPVLPGWALELEAVDLLRGARAAARVLRRGPAPYVINTRSSW